GFRMNAVRSRRENLDLRAFLASVINKGFRVLKVFVALDRLTVKASLVERGSVSGRDDADFTGWNHGRFSDRYAEKVWMDRPFSRRQRSKLYAFYAALFYK